MRKTALYSGLFIASPFVWMALDAWFTLIPIDEYREWYSFRFRSALKAYAWFVRHFFVDSVGRGTSVLFFLTMGAFFGWATYELVKSALAQEQRERDRWTHRRPAAGRRGGTQDPRRPARAPRPFFY